MPPLTGTAPGQLEGIAAPAISAPLVKSLDLWYNDGTIVVIAESVGFRVYSGILAQNATVFADMFSVPQPSGVDQEMFEDCPVVRLSDSAYDALQLLKATHDRQYYDASAVADLKVTAAILRLSTKYGASTLRQESISVLQSSCPVTLEDYKHAVQLYKSPPGERFFIANLVRETDARILLPIALLTCCAYDTDVIIDGAQYEGEHVDLSPDNKRLVLRSKPKLSLMTRTVTLRHFLIDYQLPLCDLPNCSKGRRALVKGYLGGISSEGWLSPLYQMSYDTLLRTRFGMCDSCVTEFTGGYQGGLTAAWQKLPETLGLDGWETLRADEARWQSD